MSLRLSMESIFIEILKKIFIFEKMLACTINFEALKMGDYV